MRRFFFQEVQLRSIECHAKSYGTSKSPWECLTIVSLPKMLFLGMGVNGNTDEETRASHIFPTPTPCSESIKL
jgi:hypothetical protein